MPCDRLCSPPSVIWSQLRMRRNETSNNNNCFYNEKLRAIVWRAARLLMPCDRLLSPTSVILIQLRIRRNDTGNSLLVEVKTNSMESCKVPDAL